MRLTLTHCPIDPRRALVALLVLAALALMSAKVRACEPTRTGPVRRLIQSRPGVLIPHHAPPATCATTHAPVAAQQYVAPQPVAPAQILTASYSAPSHAPAQPAPTCANGRCVIPR